MTHRTDDGAYLNALREDLPTQGDEVRIRRRLLATGVLAATTLATKATSAAGLGTVASSKAGIAAGLFGRLGELSLFAQASLIAAGTAVVVSGPVWLAMRPAQPNVPAVVGPPSAEAKRTRAVQLPPIHRASAQTRPDLVEPAIQEQPPPVRAITTAPSRPSTNARDPEIRPESSSLEGETRLLDTALIQLRSHQLDAAAETLARHQHLYPNGNLVLERQRALRKLDEARHASQP